MQKKKEKKTLKISVQTGQRVFNKCKTLPGLFIYFAFSRNFKHCHCIGTLSKLFLNPYTLSNLIIYRTTKETYKKLLWKMSSNAIMSV